jgi:hypothetical protein
VLRAFDDGIFAGIWWRTALMVGTSRCDVRRSFADVWMPQRATLDSVTLKPIFQKNFLPLTDIWRYTAMILGRGMSRNRYGKPVHNETLK